MQWAEQAGAAILAETETAAVAAQGVDMTLWVRLMGRGASVGLLRRVLHMRVLACVCGGGAGARKVPWLPGEAQVPA